MDTTNPTDRTPLAPLADQHARYALVRLFDGARSTGATVTLTGRSRNPLAAAMLRTWASACGLTCRELVMSAAGLADWRNLEVMFGKYLHEGAITISDIGDAE